MFNSDISNWNLSKVTDINCMFYYSKFNGDISNWNVSNVNNIESMFHNSQFNGDISNWNISSVIDGKEYILRYMNKIWNEEKVSHEDLICNVHYEKIDCKYVKCEICKYVYDYSIKEEWIEKNRNCPMCRSEWKNNKVYLMVNE
jgi:predicted Zn-ribbon and HTH transcriptional regulator